MVDAAAARREARRKKILENSQNRLQLISGKTTPEVNHAVPVIPVCEREFEGHSHTGGSSGISSASQQSNGVIVTEPTSAGHALINGDEVFERSDFTPLPPQIPHTERSTEQIPLWEKLAANRYDVVILSLVLQLLYNLFSVSYHDYLFFLPLAIYAAMKSMWLPARSNSNLTNMLLLLSGVSANRGLSIQRFIQASQVIGVFSQDVCIFLFTTICMQALYISVFNTIQL